MAAARECEPKATVNASTPCASTTSIDQIAPSQFWGIDRYGGSWAGSRLLAKPDAALVTSAHTTMAVTTISTVPSSSSH